MMWLLIAGVFLLALAAMAWFLICRVSRLSFLQKRAKKKKWIARLYGAGALALTALVLSLLLDALNMMVCLLHLGVGWLLCDAVFWVACRHLKKQKNANIVACCAVGATVLWLLAGWFFAHHVYETRYSLNTEKELGGSLRIVQISDSHAGATFSAGKFAEYVDEINALQPDVVVITGDFVDDDTTREMMEDFCRELSRLQTTYGVYFAFGNHDRGYYASRRGYTGDDLVAELEKNQVRVLADETVLVGERFYLVGREDASVKNRAPLSSLLTGADKNRYTVVLDHEPQEYELARQAGADLVLSGHTHGGQMIPINFVGEWTGVNDMTYGHRRVDKTDYIVNSGIGCWALQFKTGCISEIGVIDITGN